ncbi:ABC transporter substrate-binding protein [Neorhizobium sp. NCHU2750]|uniref:ABC transporter substrate-binding protein n=1 Tax=Neorhizobium sp. NCHU2750 TaxID=1825976 RepID=UPI000E73ADA6|nr:peptide/nickel ABC transporter substrate-binding protein [Neorhizobium sp. NCHU2750]
MVHDFSIDRRTFMMGAAATAASLALKGTAFGATPKKGGHFRLGMGDFATTDTLNPPYSATQYQQNAYLAIYNCLVEVGQNGDLVPELATSWEGSSDAKTWVFKIRSGVEFHNGKSLTADDVVYSINLHFGPNTPSGAKPLLADVDTITATGPLEVTFKLKRGNVNLPAILSMPALSIVPNGFTDFTKAVGTGAYVLDKFEPGVRMTATRNQKYWKPNRGNFDSIELICIKDASARAAALQAGQIDAFNSADVKTAKLLARSPMVNLVSVPSKAHYVFPMLMDADPFKDPNVRLAMKYAIDREGMVNRILNGFGTVGNDQPINSSYRYFNPDIEQRTYDPDRAKSLLKKAGMDSLATQLFVSETPFAGATDSAVLYKEQAAKAGINIDVNKVPEDGYWDNVWFHKPFCAARWSGRITEDVAIGGVYTTDAIKAKWNETHMSDPKVDQLVVAARQELDETKRRQMYYDLQQIIHDDGGAIVFAFANFVYATSKKIAFDPVGTDWAMDGSRAAERWWFA